MIQKINKNTTIECYIEYLFLIDDEIYNEVIHTISVIYTFFLKRILIQGCDK